MSESLGERGVFIAETLGSEHALLFVDVAVSHVHDSDITSLVEASEGYVGKDGLHICIIKLEALACGWQRCSGKCVACAAAHHSTLHVGVSEHGGAQAHIMRLKAF
jgi:hypothetical protein